MTTDTEFLQAYETIKLAYKEAMSKVNRAIDREEAEELQLATDAYESALKMIDEIFTIPVGLPDNIDNVQTQWDDACTLIQKLKSSKTEIIYRLKVLRAKQAPVDFEAVEAAEETNLNPEESTAKLRPLLMNNPPTYYDIGNTSGTPKTYKEIAAGLRQLIAEKETVVQFDTLFQAQVKLYKIESSGTVATLWRDTSMSLVMCTVGGKWQYLNGVYFIQCSMPGEDLHTPEAETSGAAAARKANNMIWIYPLIPSLTNCYRTHYGAFILPDMEATVSGNAFGLILTKPHYPLTTVGDEQEQLADLQQFFLDLMEAVLAGSIEELETQGPPLDTSQQVSKNIVSAADFIARNLVKGAEKTGDLMIRSTPYLMSKMKPADADAPQMPPSVQTSVEVAQKVTHVAAGVTGWVAGKVGTASLAIGRYLAPHIQVQGSRLLQKSFGYDSNEANSKMEGAMTIAAGAVEGFSTVYNGLESSAKILGKNLSENSVKIIEYKYGASAGNLAAGTFDTVGNAFVVSQNVNYITPKGLAKKMVKKTGEAVVDDYKRSLRKDDPHYIAAGSMYPDLRALKEKSAAL